MIVAQSILLQQASLRMIGPDLRSPWKMRLHHFSYETVSERFTYQLRESRCLIDEWNRTTRPESAWARTTYDGSTRPATGNKRTSDLCRPQCPGTISAVLLRDIQQCSSEQINRRPHRDGHVPRGVQHAGGVLPKGRGGDGGIASKMLV